MVANERLRTALETAGITSRQLAEAVGVDPKTAERWVSTGRTPHPTIAQRAAIVLREDLAYLWPAIEQGRRRHRGNSEMIAAYPTRATAPFEMWQTLFERAEKRIGVLVYAAVFLQESWPDYTDLLVTKAKTGCEVRILIGDADSPVIAARGQEERYGHGIETRCRVAAMHYRPLIRFGVQVHVHDTTLYNSLSLSP